MERANLAVRMRTHPNVAGTLASPLRSLWTTVGGCRIHARIASQGVDFQRPPIVLVHGFGVSSAYLVPTAEQLADEFAVYAPDLPGHGRSDAPPKPLNVSGLAECLVEWMNAVGVARASLVGNSMGCQIAVDAALRHPDRVERLVLIGPTSDPAARSFLRLAGRLLISGPFERYSLFPILVVDYLRMGWRLVPEFRSMLQDRIEEKLPRLRVPVMMVRGGMDRVAPQPWVEQAAALCGAARPVVLPGWGHAVNYSAAPQLAKVIGPFLQNPVPQSPQLVQP